MAMRSAIALLTVLLCTRRTDAELKLSTCDASSMWVTLPMNRSLVQAWAMSQVDAGDRGKISLEEPPAPYAGMSGSQPMQIEFDSFYNCKSLAGIPYPSFQEVAIQVPYVSYEGKALHFQPWALMNNIFGTAAMDLLLSGNVHAPGSAVHPNPPAAWTQAAAVSSGFSVKLSNVTVGTMRPSSALEDSDPIWKMMVATKKTQELVYKKTLGVGGFHCNNIAWHFDQANVVAINSGVLQFTSDSKPYFPTEATQALSGPLSTLSARFGQRGFAAYAVQASFTGNAGC